MRLPSLSKITSISKWTATDRVSAEWNLRRGRAGGAAARRHVRKHDFESGHQRPRRRRQPGGGRPYREATTETTEAAPAEPFHRSDQSRRTLDPVFQNFTAVRANTSPQANHHAEPSHRAGGHAPHLSIPSFSKDSHRRLCADYRQRIVSETKRAQRYFESRGGADCADHHSPSILQGFGVAVNRRFITVAEKQIGAARETFRSQLLNTVANVLNLYWSLVAADDELQVRQRALEAAQKLLDDTKKQIAIGAVARSDIYRAEAELSTRRQDLAIAQVKVQQQESLLKNTLSRNGTEDPLIDAAEIRSAGPDPCSRPGRTAGLARPGGPRPEEAAGRRAGQDQR